MFRTLNGKGVSTALATIAIILVLVMSLTWMAYTVVLNARQQAQAAERAESIALKAKELIRVYVWLDPAQQPNGRYLNLTRISFVGSWSGETTINGLLVVYRDGGSRMLGLNIRLGAGEEKTYLPSELGILGLDNYDAFRRAVKYIQAHTSLGNDFVSLWGRPDKPAIYIVTTTNTGTNTTTTTSTTTSPTTTTTTTPPPTTTTTTPPTTTTTTGPTTSTVTSTVTKTVTSTLTSTSTAYYSTRCTVTTWVGAQTTVTTTVTSTITSWNTITSTITQTVTTTLTSTSTTWVTSTITSTATSVSTVWTTVTSTYWVTTTRTSTYTVTYTTTATSITATCTQDRYYQSSFPTELSINPCWVRIVVVSGYGGPSQPSIPPSGQTSPEMLLAFIGLMFYGSYGRKVPVRRLVSVFFSPPGMAVLLVIAVFMVGPVMEAAAQTATTTVTTTVTSTSYVTSTVTTTQTVCTATTTVTSTTTGTITVTSTVYVTITTGPTTYVTSTVTVTSTAYTTTTNTYYTTTFITTTVTWTSTWTSTVTSTFTTIIWVTTTITSTSTKYTDTTTTRCLPWTCGTDCSCVWCCGC
jgi:hypothetical protein